jgi:hypothetical protein
LPLFIKPHPVMKQEEREWALSRARAMTRLKVVPTDLHPMLLAGCARFAIGNCYSTTFSVLHHMNVPTLEYTCYADHILQTTAGGSLRPEFVSEFIQRDPMKLRASLRAMGTGPRHRPTATREVLVDRALTAVLAGGAPQIPELVPA